MESGQTIVEYAMILAFIALACIGVLTQFGPFVRDLFLPILGGF